MITEVVYGYTMISAFFSYSIMVFLPNSRLNSILLKTHFVPISIGFFHIFVTIYALTQVKLTVFSFAEAKTIFSNDYFMLASWIHIAAWDLLIGQWLFKDARTRKIRHLITSAFVIVTGIMGPAGILPYLALRKKLSPT
jgi:Domain of unknown function (DUF4281)